MNPEDGPASLCALASVRQPTGPEQNSQNSILNKTDFFLTFSIKLVVFITFSINLIVFTHSGMFPQGSPTLLQASPGSGEKNHLEGLWKTI